ncbi:MAG: PAS domain S-box protein, partial [Flavobacteriaceae bacterium]
MQVFQKNSNIFNLLSEGVSEGIIVVNKNQVIVATNSSAEEMFGYAKDELLGQSLNLLIPVKHRHAHKDYVTHFVDKSEKRQMGRGRNLYGLHKNGEEFPLEAGLNPFELYGSSYVMALVMDITERKKAEKELIHWSTIFNESLNEIFIFDAKTLYFKNVNKGAMKNMGYDLEEFKKLTPVDIKPRFDETGFRNLIAPLLDRKKEKLEFESLHQRKDDTTYP